MRSAINRKPTAKHNLIRFRYSNFSPTTAFLSPVARCPLPVASVKSSPKSLLNQAGEYQLSEVRLAALTGFNSIELKKIKSWMKSPKHSHNRTVGEGLITFLFKLRTGASNKNIATVFKFDHDQRVSDIVKPVVESFENEILPTRFCVKKK